MPRCSLIICESGTYTEQLRLSLQLEYDCHITFAGDYAQLCAIMLSQPCDLVLASCSMVDEAQYEQLAQSFPEVPVIMLVNTNDIDRIQTLLSGDILYLHKPLHHTALLELVEQCLFENTCEISNESKELVHMGTSGSINESKELVRMGPFDQLSSESDNLSRDGLDANQRLREFVSIAGDTVLSPTVRSPATSNASSKPHLFSPPSTHSKASSRPQLFSSPSNHLALSSLLAGGHEVSALENRGRRARRKSINSNGFQFSSVFYTLAFIFIRLHNIGLFCVLPSILMI